MSLTDFSPMVAPSALIRKHLDLPQKGDAYADGPSMVRRKPNETDVSCATTAIAVEPYRNYWRTSFPGRNLDGFDSRPVTAPTDRAFASVSQTHARTAPDRRRRSQPMWRASGNGHGRTTTWHSANVVPTLDGVEAWSRTIDYCRLRVRQLARPSPCGCARRALGPHSLESSPTRRDFGEVRECASERGVLFFHLAMRRQAQRYLHGYGHTQRRIREYPTGASTWSNRRRPRRARQPCTHRSSGSNLRPRTGWPMPASGHGGEASTAARTNDPRLQLIAPTSREPQHSLFGPSQSDPSEVPWRDRPKDETDRALAQPETSRQLWGWTN